MPRKKRLHYREFMLDWKSKVIKSDFCELNENGELIISNSIASHTKYRSFLSIENIPLSKLMNIICHHMQVNPDAIPSPSLARRISLARSMIAYYAHYHASYSFEDIACLMDRQSQSISKTLRRHLMLANQDNQIRNTMDSLERKLSISDVDSLIL